MMPKRIRLSRQKGWRLPPGTVIASRPSIWGNPWPIGKEGPDGRIAPDAEGAAGMFADMLTDPEKRAQVGYPSDDAIRAALRGHDLACWCPLGAPCHADVLLDVANRRLP